MRGIFLGILISLSAVAQVNTETMRQVQSEDGVGGFLDASTQFSKGNEDLERLALGFRLQFQKRDAGTQDSEPRHLVFLAGQTNFGERDQKVFTNNSFAHLRWTYMWGGNWGGEIYNQFQFNEFRRLTRRAYTGAGLRFTLEKEKTFSLAIGTGYLFEFEKLNPLTTTDPLITRHHRWTNYVSMIWGSKKSARLVATLYFQPRFDAFEDYRILNENDIELHFNQWLAFVVSPYLRFDSQPPSGLQNLDTALANKLRLKF